MCDYDLIEYYELLQQDSQKINKKLSILDDKFNELHYDNPVETSYIDEQKETA